MAKGGQVLPGPVAKAPPQPQQPLMGPANPTQEYYYPSEGTAAPQAYYYPQPAQPQASQGQVYYQPQRSSLFLIMIRGRRFWFVT